eukprot:9026835-Heterocapsa_arctica.AAC.1
MPDIFNCLEAELRDFNMDDYTHKLRGQHPEARQSICGHRDHDRERNHILDIASGYKSSGPRNDRGYFVG